MILAVENSEKFHEENFVKNKKHYTYFARANPWKVVHQIQAHSARMHFNHI